MGKVSIGLRGWRFDEDAVFDEDGEFKPLEEMPADDRHRIHRLMSLVGSACDACWLLHGDENISECNTAATVYGEPEAEVVLCTAHEDDFVYWFTEAGGDDYRGEPELQDVFHEWFVEGGRAPEWFDGIDHVDTEPEAIPDPQREATVHNVETPTEKKERIDLRNMEVRRGEDAERDERDETDPVPLDDDLDLSREYPSG